MKLNMEESLSEEQVYMIELGIIPVAVGIAGAISIILKEYNEGNRIKQEIRLEQEKMKEEMSKKKEREVEKHKFKNQECIDLKDLFEARYDYIFKMLNRKFDTGEMTYEKYEKMINTCKKNFFDNLEIADSEVIRNIAADSRIEAIVKCKTLLKGIDKLMIELIKYENRVEDVDEIVDYMDELINDVKMYYEVTK